MDADQLRRWDQVARASFTYQADPVGYDNWRSHAADALAGHAWFGDCDDLASTWLDLLARAGVPLANLYRLVVDSSNCGHADHMIACAWDDAGLCWIGGDTFDPLYLARDCPHRPVQYQRLDDLSTWRDGAPWI